MTEPLATSRILTQGRQIGRSTPRVFSKPAWYRFNADRRKRYVSRIVGPATDVQATLIQSLIRLEWAALAAEDEGGLVGFREGREHRRLFQRLLGDFERTLVEAPAKAMKPKTLAEHLANRAAGRTAADIIAGRSGG